MRSHFVLERHVMPRINWVCTNPRIGQPDERPARRLRMTTDRLREDTQGGPAVRIGGAIGQLGEYRPLHLAQSLGHAHECKCWTSPGGSPFDRRMSFDSVGCRDNQAMKATASRPGALSWRPYHDAFASV
jgi:hypothetical protein